MKTHSIYLGIILLCALVMNFQSSQIGNLKDDKKAFLKKEIALQEQLVASKKRLLYMMEKDRMDSMAIVEMEREMAEREREHHKPRIIYGTKIQAVESYTASSVDSFISDMYPRPGVRKYRYNADGTRRLN